MSTESADLTTQQQKNWELSQTNVLQKSVEMPSVSLFSLCPLKYSS